MTWTDTQITKPHPAFFTAGDAVAWNAGGRTFRLTDRDIENFFDIFERERDFHLFNELYDAHLAAGGIERSSSMIRKAA